MPKQDRPQDRDPKKSEILIVRLSYEAKQAFMESCRREDRSASDVVRGLIDRYAERRATSRLRFHAKEFAMLMSNLSLPVRIAAAATAGALGAVALAVAPSTAGGDDKAAFERMDANSDGSVSLAEFYASAGMRADGAPTDETMQQVIAGTLVGVKAETGADVSDASTAAEIAEKVKGELARSGAKMQLLFKTVDADGDGAWSYDEFENMKSRSGVGIRKKPSKAEAEKLKRVKEAYELRQLKKAEE